MDRLTAMGAFVAVADQRGFARAARRLQLSPSAVTRLVAALEEHLEVRLLTRTTRTVKVTQEGERYLERARRILEDVGEAEQSAQSEKTEPAGKLTVSAPVLFGQLHVSPALSKYLDRYEHVTAELQLTDRRVNLVEEGVDVAVRIGELSDSAMIAKRVGTTRRVLVGSPKYLERAGAPRAPKDLQKHALIGFIGVSSGTEWLFHREGRAERVEVRTRFTTNSGEAAISYAKRGGGLTLALGYQVADAVKSGALKVLLPGFEPPQLPIHLTWPTSRLLSAKVRRFVELVTESSRWEFTAL